MSYLHYHSSHTRERDPYEEDPFYSRPLVRRNSKRQRVDIFDDDEYDDYPYSSSYKPTKPSRALTIRQPSQIEKYNVWSYPKSPSKHHDHSDDDDDDDRKVRYKYVTTRTSTRPSRSYSDEEDEREREFRLKVKATFGRPKSSHSSSHKVMAWPSDLFKRKEKWVDEDWETRERERSTERWNDDDGYKEKTVRYRKIKRTRTDEWKPLSGFRRS